MSGNLFSVSTVVVFEADQSPHPLKKDDEFIIRSPVSGTTSLFSAKQGHDCSWLLWWMTANFDSARLDRSTVRAKVFFLLWWLLDNAAVRDPDRSPALRNSRDSTCPTKLYQLGLQLGQPLCEGL